MLGKIGRSATPADAVALLLECHGRIRAFLAMARRLGEASDESAEAVSDAAIQVHRYFTLALPLHARDEEESSLPRLRDRDPLLDLQLDVMVREHQEHQRPLGRLTEACAEIGADPGRHRAQAGSVLQAATELDRHFFHHPTLHKSGLPEARSPDSR